MKILFLVPDSNVSAIQEEYLKHLSKNFDADAIVIPAHIQTGKASAIREWWNDVKQEADYIGVTVPLVFKALHGMCKPDKEIGYIYKPYFFLPSYKRIFFSPQETRQQIAYALSQLQKHASGSYIEPGKGIIKQALYPSKYEEIRGILEGLLDKDLTCDIETFSLKHPTSGIGSIAFAWNQAEGVAFKVDSSATERNEPVRDILRWFFENRKGRLIFHNITFDVHILIYQLYMHSLLDLQGLREGLKVFYHDYEDTMIMTYLCTNSCSGNKLSLKEQSLEFAGNYAEENISDITKIPEKDLLQYNLTDTLSTWYVYNKYTRQLDAENQREIYEGLFKDILIDLTETELVGLPINMPKVKEARSTLEKALADATQEFMQTSIIQDFVDHFLVPKEVIKRNQKLKVKKVTEADIHLEFNPKSNNHLKDLLYGYLKLPVINTTDKGEPSTDAKTLKALVNHTDSSEVKAIIKGLLDYADAEKMLSTFIPAFEQAAYCPEDGWHYLFGSQHLGGTVSGRLSSSAPNLANLPSTGATYAKLIKACFSSPPGWLYCGIDFSSLEDHISALVTKDPNKLGVYLKNYDGHCLRAYSYWKEQMPDITAQLDEIEKEGKVYKVTFDDGHIEYLNEHNSKLCGGLNKE